MAGLRIIVPVRPVNIYNHYRSFQYFVTKLLMLIVLLPITTASTGMPINTPNLLVFTETTNTTDTLLVQQIANDEARKLLLKVDSLAKKHEKQADSLLLVLFDMTEKAQITDTFMLANIFHKHGKYILTKQMYEQAIDEFKQSILFKRSIANIDSSLVAQSLNQIGITHMRLNSFDNALSFFNQALQSLGNDKKYCRDQFDIYINIGIIYAIRGSFDEAYSFFQRSYSILQEGSIIQDSLMKAVFHSNYGLLATSVGKTRDAIKHYDISEKYYVKLRGERHPMIASLNMNKGLNAYYDYDFAKAKLYTLKALDIYIENKDFEMGAPKTLYNLGSISISTEDYKGALDYSLQGLSYAPENDLRLILTLNLARSYNLLNRTQEAETAYRQALTILTFDNVSINRTNTVYEKYAEFLLLNNESDSGFVYLKKALSESQKLYGKNSFKNADLLISVGDFFQKNQENQDSSLFYYREALCLLSESDSIQLDNFNKTIRAKAIIGEALSLSKLAEQSHNMSYLLESEKAFLNVLHQMQSLSATLSSENKLVLANMLKPVYQQAIRTEHQLFEHTHNKLHLHQAFEFTESAKSSVLVASVTNQYALKTADLPEETFQFENTLKNELSTIQRLLADEKEKTIPDKRKINFFESKLLRLMNQYDSLIRQIELKSQKYYQLKYQSGVISANEIMTNLKDDEVFIEYELNDSLLYRFVLTNSDIRFDQTPISPDDLAVLTRLISIKNTRIGLENFKTFDQFCKDAQRGYDLLFGKLDFEKNDLKITIVPDGLLGYLPFEILLESPPQYSEINYRDLNYIFKHHPIAYSPSATLKFNPFFSQEDRKSTTDLLAFAPTYQNSTYDDIISENNTLNDLPYARMEANQVSQLMGGDSFIDQQATKENFMAISEQYGLLHLAMHTLINDTSPMMSKLVFYNSPDHSLSPYLNIYEIYGMSFNAQQVTLSACNTGSGTFKRGEGIMSLARGFLFAGVPSIIMTLWEVQDESGSLLMQNYYQLLKDGLPKDIALQQAKLEVLKHANMAKAHPFFWSSYVLSGDTSPILDRWDKHQWMGGLLVIIVVISSFLFINSKRKSQ